MAIFANLFSWSSTCIFSSGHMSMGKLVNRFTLMHDFFTHP
jgi:hypothetical protein